MGSVSHRGDGMILLIKVSISAFETCDMKQKRRIVLAPHEKALLPVGESESPGPGFQSTTALASADRELRCYISTVTNTTNVNLVNMYFRRLSVTLLQCTYVCVVLILLWYYLSISFRLYKEF
jgi:hypothetical protein